MSSDTYKDNAPVVMLKIKDAAKESGMSAYIIRKWALDGTISAVRDLIR